MKLSSASTLMPRSSNASQRCEPMKPAPPDTTARSRWLVPTNAPIREPEAPHHRRGVDVASIDDHRPTHRHLQATEVEMAELVPFRDQYEAVRAIRQRIGVGGVFDLRQQHARPLHRGRVVGTDLGAGREQHPCDVQARRVSKVVRVGLERPPEEPDNPALERVEAFPKLVDGEHPLIAVYGHDRVQQLWVIVKALRQRGERFDVLGKARTAITDAGVEEAGADALVETHSLSYKLGVRVDRSQGHTSLQ